MNIRHRISSTYPSLLAGLILGILVIGLNGINPLNIGWFNAGDPLVHYLGWEYFRQSPWSFPPGLNPDYGLEVGSSIVYTDAIPLTAFLLKPISNLLPYPFQYLGLWSLLCFVLQAYFGALLAKKITDSNVAQVLISIFFVFTPIFLYRLGFHTALVSHFLLLSAIWLSITRKRFTYWLILIALSILINSYIFAMVMGLWLGSMLDKLADQHNSNQGKIFSLSTQIASVTLMILIIFWASGYFAISSQSYGLGGFGTQRINILSPLNAQTWSYLLPQIPEAYRDLIGGNTGLDFYARRSESFQFLGLGFIVLIFFSLPAIWSLRSALSIKLKTHKYLILILIAFVLFALSNHIGIASYSLIVPLPDVIIKIASTLRASARFFWPIVYCILITCLWTIFNYYSHKKSILIVAFCLLIQIFDTSPGWLKIHQKMSSTPSSAIPSPLMSPFWEIAAKHYTKLKVIPLNQVTAQAGWDVFGIFALNHHLKTNISYMSRIDNQKIESYNTDIQKKIRSGQHDQDTFFIVEETALPLIYKNLEPSDLLAEVDGFLVLAPGWFDCQECLGFNNPKSNSIADRFKRPQPKDTLSFGKGGNGLRYLNGGFGATNPWGYPESWGIWMTGFSAKVTVPLPSASIKAIKLDLRFPVSPSHPSTTYQIDFFGHSTSQKLVASSGQSVIEIPIPNQSLIDGYITLSFYVGNPVTPKSIGIGDDTRIIGLGLASISFK